MLGIFTNGLYLGIFRTQQW